MSAWPRRISAELTVCDECGTLTRVHYVSPDGTGETRCPACQHKAQVAASRDRASR